MATQKRTHEEIDPDYDDACQQQTKRQRELEQDAKQSVSKRIQHIVKNEFQTEISNKEMELQQVDKRLNDARLMMDRLRACVVANYYGQVNRAASSQASSSNAPPPSIHPAVKKYLGKRPAHFEGKPDLSTSQLQSDQSPHAFSNQDSSTGSRPKENEEDSRVKENAMSQNLLWGRSTSFQSSPAVSRHATPSNGAPSVSVAGSTYDDRRARLKIKKKIIIGNVSKYIPVDHREANDMSSHKWMVYVRGPKSDPDISSFVKKVWFFLHHSYKPNDLVEISSPPFHLTRRGWGEFPVRVQLHFVDPRNKKVDIIHHLKLDKTFTGLQTLGAETVVEVELERDFFESLDSNSNNVTASCSSSSVSSLYRPSSSSLSLSSTSSTSVRENIYSGHDTQAGEKILQLLRQEGDTLAKANSNTDLVKQSQAGQHDLLLDNKSEEVMSSLSSGHESVVQKSSMEMCGGVDTGAKSLSVDSDGIVIDNCESEAANIEEYNVTIAHDVDENSQQEAEEEMVVDIGDAVSDLPVSRNPIVMSQTQLPVLKEQSVTLVDPSPSLSDSSLTSSAGVTEAQQSCCHSGPSVSLPSSSSSLLSLASTSKAAVMTGIVQYISTVKSPLLTDGQRQNPTSSVSLTSPSSSLVKSTPMAAAAGSVQYCPTVKNSSLTKGQTLQSISKTVTTPAATVLVSPSLAASQGLTIRAGPSIKIGGTARVVEIPQKTSSAGLSLLNKNTKVNAALTTSQNSQALTVIDSSSLKKSSTSSTVAASVNLMPSSPSASSPSSSTSSSVTAPPPAFSNLQASKTKSLLSASVNTTGSTQPQISLSYLTVCAPQLTRTGVPNVNSQIATNPSTGPSTVSSTAQSQSSLLPNAQRMIILNPNALSRPAQQVAPSTAQSTVSVNNNAAFLPKPNSQRQVSLLTGRIVSPQTPPTSVNQISSASQRPSTANSYALPNQISNQTVVLDKSANQVISFAPKTASQFLLLNRAGQTSLLATSSTASQISMSQSLNSQVASYNGLATVADNSELVMINPGVPTQKLVRQVSLLSNRVTPPGSSLVQNSRSAISGLGNSNIVLCVPSQLQAAQGSNAQGHPYTKMSAIGITKHGKDYRSVQAANLDKRAITEEERKRSQYDILKAWKENPHLYERSGTKAKKVVLAAKDQIEGEVDIIPELNTADYRSLRALVTAAVRLHPIVQAGVNKLTHPYCAESVEQWMSWPVGKQRASEWHRACFVLKYLKSCLRNAEEFRGEGLMTTQQLVSWCRLHAFSPSIRVRKTSIKQENMEDVSHYLPNSLHFHSFTPIVEVECELTAASSTSAALPSITTAVNGYDGCDSEDLEIVGIETDSKKISVKTEVSESNEDVLHVEWLPPTEGAVFVYDDLRKRGIRLQPVEVVSDLMSLTAADMLFKAMLEFSSDILREAVAAKEVSNSPSDEVSRLDVHTALKHLPEALFCCNKYLGKEEEGDDGGGGGGR